ncbi:MAG: hypothetical protein ACHQ9S_27280 [Candidatus Binatia bacterium]
MRRCAYCGSAGRLTREDIFSTFLREYYPSYRTHLDHTRDRRGRDTPVVRDVCRLCNNITLGSLDAYMAQVNADYLSVSPPEDGVMFRYDYDRLLRYLLKVWYNSARASRQSVAEYARFAPYILGRESEPPLPTTLFLALLGEFELPTEGGRPSRHTPQNVRLGNVTPEDAEWSERIVFGPLASFNAYLFVAEFWRPDVLPSLRDEFACGVAARWNLVVLSPHWTAVRVSISRIDTLASLLTSFTGGHGTWRERPTTPPNRAR